MDFWSRIWTNSDFMVRNEGNGVVFGVEFGLTLILWLEMK
jgi:hypothetical protein